MKIEVIDVTELDVHTKRFTVIQDGIASTGWRIRDNGLLNPPARAGKGGRFYDVIYRGASNPEAWEELERAIRDHFAPTKPQQANETGKRKFCRGCYLEKPRGDMAHIADCPQASSR